MKQAMLTALALLTLFLLLPALLVGDAPAAALLPPSSPAPGETAGPSAPLPELDRTVTLRVKKADGNVYTTTMDKYLPGVVAAEMPAAFEGEALKSQAIAARTYAYSKLSSSSSAHPDADLCTDYACCQAWRSESDVKSGWGNNADAYWQKIASAVAATDGQVVLYEGQPIRAVFFSSAEGRTNAAVEVWGSDVPYLTGVDTPEGNEVPNFHSTVEMTAEEFKAAFLSKYPGADLSGEPAGWFGACEYSSSGGVSAIPVGGVRLSGSELRTLLGLRSANFRVAVEGQTITFTVTGYGHGVGMSQYGANAMAKTGADCAAILTHYYSGVTIAPYPDL